MLRTELFHLLVILFLAHHPTDERLASGPSIMNGRKKKRITIYSSTNGKRKSSSNCDLEGGISSRTVIAHTPLGPRSGARQVLRNAGERPRTGRVWQAPQSSQPGQRAFGLCLCLGMHGR
jgi:hypothetical protein